ncbi:MAG: ABC transporter substrate-binding protein [Polyangiaceae bacterium]|nr:ABC transporter substrate-binding protein [Polyangiaceae bacterium]
MNRAVRSFLALASLLAVAATAHAGPAADAVTTRRNEVISKMKEAASKERDQKVAAIMGQMFDFDAMGKASLGKEWAGLSDAQRTEFLGLLKQLVQRSIERNVRATMNYDLQLIGEEGADSGTLVKTKATNKKNGREEPVAIDYLLHEADGGWRVKDVVTEGSSMVGNYKSQFVRIIKKDGFDALTKKMKDKLKKGE